MVVTLSPFKANMDISDVLLPIAPFTETSGTFINAEGRVQSFHAVVKPQGDTRPAWKVLRVLADMLGIASLPFDSSQQVLAQALGAAQVSAIAPERLNNRTTAVKGTLRLDAAVAAVGIYQLDSIVRRAPALQMTADGREGVAP
jgi:NADH-quinone oxidoreductase subunit G